MRLCPGFLLILCPVASIAHALFPTLDNILIILIALAFVFFYYRKRGLGGIIKLTSLSIAPKGLLIRGHRHRRRCSSWTEGVHAGRHGKLEEDRLIQEHFSQPLGGTIPDTVSVAGNAPD